MTYSTGKGRADGSDTAAAAVGVPIPGPTTPQASQLHLNQSYLCLPTFTLESGEVLHNLPVAYKTWGTLDPSTRANALVVCHALTGSADVEDWWGPLLGPGKLFDPTRFFIFCANVLGSPYGSAGPCTRKRGERLDRKEGELDVAVEGRDGRSCGWWGPEFPPTTVRDDVRVQKLVLDHLGVEQIAAVVGGSMGGMAVLEWPLCFPVRFPSQQPFGSSEASSSSSSTSQRPYIRAVVPIATAARHSAWGISWAEAQRQSIYSDPKYQHGYYPPDDPPRGGLSAARMAALLTYRSRESFESRFGRRQGGRKTKADDSSAKSVAVGNPTTAASSGSAHSSQLSSRRASTAEEHARAHNEGNKSPQPTATVSDALLSLNGLALHKEGESALPPSHTNGSSTTDAPQTTSSSTASLPSDPSSGTLTGASPPPAKVFSAQSYLRYQGDKFVQRFDANCYVHLTRKMDAHDVARGREEWFGLNVLDDDEAAELTEEEETIRLAKVLGLLGRDDDEEKKEGQDAEPTRLAAPPHMLVVSIESDGLFAPPEQQLIHSLVRGSRFSTVRSADGHDGFLLEFEQINEAVQGFLREVLGGGKSGEEGHDVYAGQGAGWEDWKDWGKEGFTAPGEAAAPTKESVFGEVEDLTRW